jgi:hypothetical protein
MKERSEQAVYRYDWEDVPPSVAVVEALSDSTGRDSTDLPTLNDSIDPDALDALCSDSTNDREAVTVTFAYAGHTVTVLGDGTVVLNRDRTAHRLDQ